jgi:hypothetical protein
MGVIDKTKERIARDRREIIALLSTLKSYFAKKYPISPIKIKTTPRPIVLLHRYHKSIRISS